MEIHEVTVNSIEEAAQRIAAQRESRRQLARDPVNQAMVNNWVEAIGDTNPRYTRDAHGGPVAPPAMIQVWTMKGLHGQRADDDPMGIMSSILDGAGYTSVVGTNSAHTYHRYLRPGEHVAMSSKLASVTGPKRTTLGEGWFVTTRTTWWVGDEAVAEMLLRVLKFRPATASAPGVVPGAAAGRARGRGRPAITGELPPMTIEARPTFIISTALATRDFQDVHHDRDAAIARGTNDIFVNILTGTGLVQRFVTKWAGPEALLKSIKIRLGVPCYAYDTLTFTGRVTRHDGGEVDVAVTATGNLGEHLTGTVRLVVPEGR